MSGPRAAGAAFVSDAMREADWGEVEAALDRLIDLPADERPREIVRLAAGRAGFAARLRALSASLETEDPLLDRPAAALLPCDDRAPGDLPPGARIGPWRVDGLIGRGGMGEVYRAERADGLYTQAVALKLVRLDMAQDVRRFELERRTLALLEHPSIARLVDGGLADDGRPYMALELVEGATITAWCRERHAALADRLLSFMQVCDAVAHAHRHLVVHLDLKPSNVLVNAEGRVKLLDFGIARLLQGPDAAAAQTRQLVLTPNYCAPEQLTGESVTTAADVHALGLLLHELLVGEPALALDGQPLAVAVERVVHGTLPAPSRHAARIAMPAVAAPQLRGDLDAIVAKATRRDPLRRYDSVAALRHDLERHLQREPVAAREGARLYALGRLLRRHRALAASFAVSIAALAGGAAAVAWQARLADIEARKAVAERNFLIDIFRQNSNENPDGVRARQTTAEQLLDLAARRVQTELRDQREVRAEMMDTLFAMFDQLQQYPRMVEFERQHLAEIERLDGTRPSRELASVQFGLGRSLMMTGDNAGGEAQLKAAMATLDALDDTRSPLRADVLMHLARIAARRRAPGDSDIAEQMASQAQALYAHDDMNWLYAGQVIANVQEQRNDPVAAVRQLRPLLQAAKRPPFDRAPITAAFLESDLGYQLGLENHISEGVAMSREAVELMTRTEGPDKPDTAVSRARLGLLEYSMNHLAEGERQLRTALDDLGKAPGPDDLLWTVPIRLMWARISFQRGDLAVAQAETERVLRAFEARAPSDRNHFPRTLVLEGTILAALGRDDEARAQLERANRLWPRDTSGGMLSDGRRMLLEAILQARAGRASDARAMFAAMRAAWPMTPDELPEPWLQATLVQARLDAAAGAAPAAVDALRPLVARVEADPDHDHLVVWEGWARHELGSALCAMGHADEGVAQLGQAVALRARWGVPASAWTAESRAALARCSAGVGQAVDDGASRPRRDPEAGR
jgi:tetratricopeptide (TPR) repeat protein